MTGIDMSEYSDRPREKILNSNISVAMNFISLGEFERWVRQSFMASTNEVDLSFRLIVRDIVMFPVNRETILSDNWLDDDISER